VIDEALRRTGGNKQAAASLLGVKRTTLVAKMRGGILIYYFLEFSRGAEILRGLAK
jgi:hypothetical protein